MGGRGTGWVVKKACVGGDGSGWVGKKGGFAKLMTYRANQCMYVVCMDGSARMDGSAGTLMPTTHNNIEFKLLCWRIVCMGGDRFVCEPRRSAAPHIGIGLAAVSLLTQLRIAQLSSGLDGALHSIRATPALQRAFGQALE